MGIEYEARFCPTVSLETIKALKDAIILRSCCHVVREEGDEIGLHVAMKAAMPLEEQVTLLLKPDRFYVVFNSAHRTDRMAFLASCQEVFKDLKLQSILEEL